MTGYRDIRKVLIANRGEIAVRIIRTCRELGVATVAVYSDADRTMPHVVLADEAYRIGLSPSRESYLRMDTIIDVARTTGADAIHPGYGFLSENPEFAKRVVSAGLIFIGPDSETIAAMGDKTAARRLVSRAGIPVVPGTTEPVKSEEEARDFAESAGYPVLIKAAAGGGGKGMRVVRGSDELLGSLQAAHSEALSSFGDGRVYLEKYLDHPRHIEFQILADRYGTTIHLGERECSIQRRHQKVIEETPSVAISEELRYRMGETAVAAAKACHYVNAGTIEFLVDSSRNFYFLEMNTRLQVEHPVTEMRTGLDLVAFQLAIAAGNALTLSQESIRFSGHAMECRICAEDPDNSYLPSTGTIVRLRSAQGIGIREDRGIERGDEVSMYYDPMIAKLIAWAPTRGECIRRLLRALHEYEIVGVTTNISLCRFVLQHREFQSGNFDTHFLDDEFKAGVPGSDGTVDRRAVAALCALLEDAACNAMNPGSATMDNSSDMNGWRRSRLDGMRP